MKRNTHQLFRIAIKIYAATHFIDVLVARVLDNLSIDALHSRAEGKVLKPKLPYIALYTDRDLVKKVLWGFQVDRRLA